MRRADLVWLYTNSTSTFTDVTQSIGAGNASITVGPSDKLYIACKDWIAGACLFAKAINGTPTFIPEMWDAESQQWQELPVQEKINQTITGVDFIPSAYDYASNGVVTWNTARWRWSLRRPSSTWPENAPIPYDPPQSLFWVRLRNTSASSSSTFSRMLPTLYNTYISSYEAARFIGVAPFTEDNDPTETFIKNRIRAAEDWLDNYMRQSFRVQERFNERHVFSPYGNYLFYRPVWFIARLGVWTGSSFQPLLEGRNQDFYVSIEDNEAYFTRISLGRGLPWSRVASRFLRQPDSIEIDYVYGGDFDMAPKRDIITDIILKRVGHDFVMQYDWHSQGSSNQYAVPKPEKARLWWEQAQEEADTLRAPLII